MKWVIEMNKEQTLYYGRGNFVAFVCPGELRLRAMGHVPSGLIVCIYIALPSSILSANAHVKLNPPTLMVCIHFSHHFLVLETTPCIFRLAGRAIVILQSSLSRNLIDMLLNTISQTQSRSNMHIIYTYIHIHPCNSHSQFSCPPSS